MCMLMKVLVVAILGTIIYSLGSGLFYMMRSGGRDDRMVKSLTLRVALSVGLFILLLIAAAAGWIHPHGVTP